MPRPVLRRWILIAGILVVALGADLARSPADQWSAKALLGGIDLYQATLSKALGASGARCRFEPTCSHYGEAVIHKYGAAKGSALALARIARCGPWTPAGTHDPPP